MEDITVETIPGNMYHLNTCKINFTKKSRWLVIVIITEHVFLLVMLLNKNQKK